MRIEIAVLEQLGLDIFGTSQYHFFEHALGTETDHLSVLLRLITSKYVSLRLKTWKKVYRDGHTQKCAFSEAHINKSNSFQKPIESCCFLVVNM